MFTSLGAAFFRVTLRDRTHTFVEKATTYENDVTHLFLLFQHGSNVKSGKKM